MPLISEKKRKSHFKKLKRYVTKIQAMLDNVDDSPKWRKVIGKLGWKVEKHASGLSRAKSKDEAVDLANAFVKSYWDNEE